MTKIFDIYLVWSPSGKAYIGRTCQFRHRKARHIYDAHVGQSSTRFARAIRKYGDALDWFILESGVPETTIRELEQEYIFEFSSANPKFGYNLTNGGDGTWGYKFSAASREKMRQAQLGKKASEETRARLSKAHEGRDYSTSIAALNQYARTIHCVPVIATKDGETTWFHSVKACAEATNRPKENVHQLLRSGGQSKDGYRFERAS